MAKTSLNMPSLIFLLGLIACLELSVFTGGVIGATYPCKTDSDCYIRRCRVGFWRLCVNGECICQLSPIQRSHVAAKTASTTTTVSATASSDIPPCGPTVCASPGDPPNTPLN